VRIDLPSGSQNQCTESVINAHNEKVEDFLVDPDGSIHFLTDKGMIRSLTDPNLQINCAEGQNPVVNYWNKLIRVGDNSFLAAGYCADQSSLSNILTLGRYNQLNRHRVKINCTEHNIDVPSVLLVGILLLLPRAANARDKEREVQGLELRTGCRGLLYHPLIDRENG
jgi:hypothetical protein